MSLWRRIVSFALFLCALNSANGAALEARQAATSSRCQVVAFQVTASSFNRLWTLNVSDQSTWNRTIVEQLFTLPLLPTVRSSRIVGTYCVPVVPVPGRSNTLEVFLQSITNNRGYWFGLSNTPGGGYQGNNYSWIEYASKLGYPTLALDRLGNGDSDHPDPILVAQGPYEYQLYKALIDIIKSGNGSPLPRTYQDIVLIGHSYGSVIVDNMLRLFPTLVNKAILTGYSKDGIKSFPGISLVLPAPAAIAIPQRFGNLPLGYLTTTSTEGRRGGFYTPRSGIDYDEGIFQLDVAVRDVVSIGQFLSNYLDGARVAPDYKGRVLVLTGEQDDAFCGPGSFLLGPAKCGQSLPNTKQLFPAADYSWYSIANTGHANDLHFSRVENFDVAHRFIAGASFSKTG